MSRFVDDPNMSDSTLLVSVEDLINRALGPPDANTVNFKLVQMILHILARQQRMLEQRVEIRGADLETSPPRTRKEKARDTSTSSSSKSPRSPTKKRMAGIKEERAKKDESGKKEKDEKTPRKYKELDKAEKEKEKLDKAEKKERERAEREKKRAEREREKSPAPSKGAKKARVMSGTGIEITETERDKEKVLVVEKGPTTRDSRGRTSIEVVTQSQFALLEGAVNELKDIAVPKPLVLPDNEKLISELAKGNATLPDAMEAMQVTARIKAAENAIKRMAGLLTQLAASGALPEDIAQKVEEVNIEPPAGAEGIDAEKPVEAKKSLQPVVSKKSVVIVPKPSETSRIEVKASKGHHSAPTTPRPSSKLSLASKHSMMSMGTGITHEEMNAALRELREELSKQLNMLTSRATAAAENALHTAMTLADKLDVALMLDRRITTLYSLVADYSEQLSGFDSGLTTQMQSFQDQIAQIRSDLKGGLTQLENVNNNAETAAVMELSERYQELVSDLEGTLHAHRTLTTLHSKLGGEMHSLVECVEMLREQKSDRDEVLDGLRDKADSTRLSGLLKESDFDAMRVDFERRLALCHEKFNRQDAVWMAAIRDLTRITDDKAEIIDLLSAREEAEKQLQLLHDKVGILAAVLGEPKAALLTRQLTLAATCGACQGAAAMSPRDAVGGAPAPLPALRPPPPLPSDEPCIADWVTTKPEPIRHICHRWCGGSHTRITEATKKEKAPPVQLQSVPTKRFTGYGSDGRLYMMEDELQPCVECNIFQTNDCGAGDSPDSPIQTTNI